MFVEFLSTLKLWILSKTNSTSFLPNAQLSGTQTLKKFYEKIIVFYEYKWWPVLFNYLLIIIYNIV